MALRAVPSLIAAMFLSAMTAVGQNIPTPATAPSSQVGTAWPTKEGNVVVPNFRFGTGETLAQLKLHYITLGTPHRNAAGHVDNAVLLLHGTGGMRIR